MIIENTLLSALKSGKTVLGVALRQARTVDISRMMKTCGYDFLFIDTEHTPIPYDTVSQICQAALGLGISPLVRVPNLDRTTAVYALDSGAQGLIFPHVENAEEARQIVDMCRYPPRDNRSVAYALPNAGFASMDPRELMDSVNRETILGVMLETPEAIERADEIAAVPGVDMLHVGTQDLSAELGEPGNVGTAAIGEAFIKVAAACERHVKILGSGGCYQPDLIQKYAKLGVRLFVIGSDIGFMMGAARSQAASVRSGLSL